MKLRKHQRKQNKLLLKSLKKHNHVLYAAPTGFGKSVCILDLVRRFVDNGDRVLVIAPYRKLVYQLLDTFAEEYPALLMGSDSYGNPMDTQIIVASLSTLSRRLKMDEDYVGGIDKILIDEVHLGFNIPNGCPSDIVKPIYNRYWISAKWIGFTATPITASGYRLDGWEDTVFKYNTRWLIDKGWLSDFKYMSVPAIDAHNLKLQVTGDYKVEDMEQVTTNAAAISAVYKNYKKHCKGKKTLLFAVSILHGELIQNYMADKGVCCRIIHSNLSEGEQRRILEEYKNNVFDVLINVAMLTTGFDDPEVEALIIARPIGSLRLAIQVWGRALRYHDDIDKVLILDLTGVYDIVGYMPDDDFDFNRVKGNYETPGESKSISEVILDCPNCDAQPRMIDCTRDTQLTDKISVTTYYCPECGEVIDEKSIDLSVNKVKKIKTAKDIDYSIEYSMEDVNMMLGKLIKMNTRNAKTSWGSYIHKTCMRLNPKAYKEVFYMYAQDIIGAKRAWKRIMDIYNGSKHKT